MKNINYLLLGLIMLISSCTIEDPDPPEPVEPMLPPITMTGENTFGFLLDGEVWLPKDDLSTNPFKNIFHSISYAEISGALRVQVESIDTLIIEITKLMSQLIFLKKGFIKCLPPPFHGIVNFDFNLTPCHEYKSEWETETRIEILKLDQSDRIVAGLFEYTAHNDCMDTIEITDGRFDFEY